MPVRSRNSVLLIAVATIVSAICTSTAHAQNQPRTSLPCFGSDDPRYGLEIHFEPMSSELSASALQEIANVITVIKSAKKLCYWIEPEKNVPCGDLALVVGLAADSEHPSERIRQTVAERRATAVAKVLADTGFFPRQKMFSEGRVGKWPGRSVALIELLAQYQTAEECSRQKRGSSNE